MAIIWTEDLATGVPLIDHQHKELFMRVNDLLEACHQGKAKDRVNQIVRFLENYVVTHFAEEERHMVASKYHGYAAHKAMHREFIESFGQLKKRIETDEIGLTTVISTNKLVVDWLTNHIRKVDRELGTFLRDKSGYSL